MIRRSILLLSLHLMAMPVCALEWDNETLRRAQIEMTGYLDSALLRNYKSLDIDMARKSLKLAMPVPNLLTLSWQQKLKELPRITRIFAFF